MMTEKLAGVVSKMYPCKMLHKPTCAKINKSHHEKDEEIIELYG